MTYPDPRDPCNDATIDKPCDDLGEPGDVTEHEVQCAQKNWCLGLLKLCEAYRNDRRNFRPYAEAFIYEFYDFNEGRVFFRPTLAMFPNNFRTTFDGTLEYFIGANWNPDLPDDPNDGFAKKPFVRAAFSNRVDQETVAIQRFGNVAVAMGNVCLTDNRDETTVVDKVFAYRKDENDKNRLKLIVHMSAKRNVPGEAAVE
jgi:hypothetical protein